MMVPTWMRLARWTLRETAIVAAPGIICVVLAVLVAVETVDSSDPLDSLPPATHSSPNRSDGGAERVFALPPIDAFAEVTNRPLFSPTRRPPEHAEDALGSTDELVLTGIVVSAFDRTALIRHGQPLKTARVREGQSIAGWTVRSISTDRVLIENAGTEHELRLGPKTPRDSVVRQPG
jgi:hypothetical protein